MAAATWLETFATWLETAATYATTQPLQAPPIYAPVAAAATEHCEDESTPELASQTVPADMKMIDVREETDAAAAPPATAHSEDEGTPELPSQTVPAHMKMIESMEETAVAAAAAATEDSQDDNTPELASYDCPSRHEDAGYHGGNSCCCPGGCYSGQPR